MLGPGRRPHGAARGGQAKVRCWERPELKELEVARRAPPHARRWLLLARCSCGEHSTENAGARGVWGERGQVFGRRVRVWVRVL